MVTKRQLNPAKRYLDENIKELNEFLEAMKTENTWNNTDTDTDKENLMNQLHDYRKEVQLFETTLPENDETEALINN